MASQDSLLLRVEKLEAANRKLRLLATLPLLFLCVLVVSGQRRPSESLVTQKLILKDGSGTIRAELGLANAGVYLHLSDPKGVVQAALGVAGDENKSYLNLSSGGAFNAMHLQMAEGKPSIELYDASGFETVIGAASTVSARTGEEHKTSAASITMFGNDKGRRVIWQAP